MQKIVLAVALFLTLVTPAMAVTESEVLANAFTAPKSEASFYPTITTMMEMKTAMEEWARFKPADLWAPQSVVIDDTSVMQNEVLTVQWHMDSRAMTTNGFYKTRTGPDYGRAVLIIPGSGDNQGRQVYQGQGYHGDIVAQMRQYGDTFVYVRAGHDFRNLTDGINRVSDALFDGITTANGTSHDTLWAIEMVAIVKYLRQHYNKVIVAGLSQGATFASLVCLLTAPDACALASGFSLKEYDFSAYGAGGGMNIPGLMQEWPEDRVKSVMQAQTTRYMLSYSTAEGVSLWGLEASEGGPTATELNLGARMNLVIHGQGHVFPQPQTNSFVSE